jgi:hypothetical protein
MSIEYSNVNKMLQMSIKILTFYNVPTYVRPSEIYPNWDFLLENKPSGNPALDMTQRNVFNSQKCSDSCLSPVRENPGSTDDENSSQEQTL